MQITGIENRHSSRVTQRCALEHGVLRVAGLQVDWPHYVRGFTLSRTAILARYDLSEFQKALVLSRVGTTTAWLCREAQTIKPGIALGLSPVLGQVGAFLVNPEGSRQQGQDSGSS